MKTLIVAHSGYGCDTGCCGHTLKLGEKTRFTFGHPSSLEMADLLEFAREAVTEEFGAEHVVDLDWDHVVFDEVGTD